MFQVKQTMDIVRYTGLTELAMFGVVKLLRTETDTLQTKKSEAAPELVAWYGWTPYPGAA